MQTITNPDHAQLAQQWLEIFSTCVDKVLEQKDTVVIAIPGGRSILPFFSLLVEQKDFAWNKTRWFMVDERLVDNTNEESNFLQANTVLFERLIGKGLLTKDQVFPFVYDAQSVDYGTQQYGATLTDQGDVFDIVLLGAGEDGHIAALFPGHEALSSSQHGFITLQDSPKPPSGRMTSSPALITGAQYAFIFFIGEGKRQAFVHFGNESVSVEQCPAKLVQQAGTWYVVTDLDESDNDAT